MSSVVLTVIGRDRPGLVDALSRVVAEHGGNWEESRMSHLADQFEKLSSPDEKSPVEQFDLGTLNIRSDPTSLRITERDLVSVLKSSNLKSACGHDGIGYSTIQRVCENQTIRRAFIQTMMKWFEQGFPEPMKCAKVIPIAKGKSHEDGYRPISLLPCMSKVSEKILIITKNVG